jgi:drug/metabolite transporter (DMT)-like permease
MAFAGIAWGVYSIRGRTESDALASTASNFMLSLAMVLILIAFTLSDVELSTRGIALAVVSGAVTSGLGYVIWYAALEYLSSMQAALVQLSVPAIATAGGVVLLAEPLSFRLLVSSALVLGGISLALVRKTPK